MYGLDGAIPGRVDGTFCVLFAFDVMYSVLQVTSSQGATINHSSSHAHNVWQIRRQREEASGRMWKRRRYAKKADS